MQLHLTLLLTVVTFPNLHALLSFLLDHFPNFRSLFWIVSDIYPFLFSISFFLSFSIVFAFILSSFARFVQLEDHASGSSLGIQQLSTSVRPSLSQATLQAVTAVSEMSDDMTDSIDSSPLQPDGVVVLSSGKVGCFAVSLTVVQIH